MERRRGKKESPTPFLKSLLDALVLPSSHPPPLPKKKTIFLCARNAKQRGYQKSDPGGDHYYVGCLGQTHVSLPE